MNSNGLRISVVLALLSGVLLVSSAQARGWQMVDDSDGAQLVCCKKYKKIVPKKRVVKKQNLTPCAAIPTAKTLPLAPGEKLPPANVKRCISCDQEYGTIQ